MLTSEGKGWSGTVSPCPLAQKEQEKKRRQGVVFEDLKEYSVEPEPKPEVMMRRKGGYTREQLQSRNPDHHRHTRYQAPIPQNVPGYLTTGPVTTETFRGYNNVPHMDLDIVHVYLPDTSFQRTPSSVHYHPGLESSSESKFSMDSESSEDRGAHAKTEDMGRVRSFTQGFGWNRRNGSAGDAKTVHREEAEPNTKNNLRRIFQELIGMGNKGARDRKPKAPLYTPEDSLHTGKRGISDRMLGLPANGELERIPGYAIKRPRTTGGGHLLPHQDTIPMNFARGGPSLRASHQALPSVRASSRSFPTWKKDKPKEKAFEYPRYTGYGYLGNQRPVTEIRSMGVI